MLKQKYNLPNQFSMRGNSMLPTLKPGEILIIDSLLDKKSFKIGDIIVFKDPSNIKKNIVHRIIQINDNGYYTRGDNNMNKDNYIVNFNLIYGKVISVNKHNSKVNIKGSMTGRFIHLALRVKKKSLFYLLLVPRLLSKKIEKWQFLKLFHRYIKFTIIIINKDRKPQEILIHKTKLIGKKDINTNEWKILFPYKYFINKNKL